MNAKSLCLACLVLLTACGGESAGPDPNPNDQNPGNTNMSARIDGVAWSPELAVTVVNAAPGVYSITGFRANGANNYTMVFALYNITGPGTYPLGVDPSVFGGSANLSRPPSSGWSTPLNGTSGEFTITTLTATRMVATFRFDAAPLLPGTTGSPRVTEGVLNAPVSGTGGLAPANQGSKLTGNIGGAFAAASATGNLTNAGPNGVLTVVGNDGTRSITINLANMTGPGTYALSATTPFRTIGVSGTPGNLTATWASQAAGGGGSVQVTSVTANRIAGSFTATLVPLAGGATGTLTVSGNFDIARRF